MRHALVRAGGGLAVALSVFLLGFVVLGSIGGVGLNLASGWTIVICGLAGLFAIEGRVRPALVLLVLGAAPALIGGIGFLYLPSLLLIALGALAPDRHSSSPGVASS